MNLVERVAFFFLLSVVGFLLCTLTLFFLPVVPYWIVLFVYAVIGAIFLGELNTPNQNVKAAGFGICTTLIIVLLVISYQLGLVTSGLMAYYMGAWLLGGLLFFRIDKLIF